MKNFSVNMLVWITIISLTSCSNMKAWVKERQEANEQAYLNQASISCKRYGFTENTDAFAQCIQNEVNSIKNREHAESSRSTRTSCDKTISGFDCTTK